MMVMLYDFDQNDKDDLIGRVWVTFQSKVRTPKWYNILYEPTDQIQGKVLLAYTLEPNYTSTIVPLQK